MTIATESADGRTAVAPLLGGESGLLPWLIVLAFAALTIVLKDQAGWLIDYPTAWTLPIATWVGDFVEAFVELTKPFFRAISWLLDRPMTGLKLLLQWLPWIVTIALFTLTAWQAAGRGTAIFTACALLYVVIVGYWSESMNTLSLVGLSIPLSIATGFTLGIWAYRSPRAQKIIDPTLDFMQTIPAFAYLIPILLLFGFGPVVGLIASAIFAAPPMVRNTILGLQRVPSDIRESGAMSGCTPAQRFWWVEVPTAMPQLMVGFNQSTMAALSMVIIAAIIGGFEDIGWEVLSTMRKAQFGQSLLAGIVIALLAMVLDRITGGFAEREKSGSLESSALSARNFGLAALAIIGAGVALALIIPVLWEWPENWEFYPAKPLNDAVTYITTNYSDLMTAIKNATLFYFMLPIKLGLERAVAPFTWGFSLTPAMKLGYFALVLLLIAISVWRYSWRTGVTVALFGGLLFYGTTGTPWPAFIAVVTLLGFQAGGWRVGIFVLAAQLFILVTDLWQPAMLSVYLCSVAVAICVILGLAMGIWASTSDRVSAFIRPINDTLQTMPQFVLLIPILMLFGVGEFTALLAIVAYAVVPAIRYTEQGLRNVSPTLIEAGRSMGCTPSQLFWQVKMPQAAPEILLGINQTILFGLAMLVIAALVGTTGLGQQIFLALGRADPGAGLVSGLAMAFIAMIADRILQAAAHKRKEALGIT